MSSLFSFRDSRSLWMAVLAVLCACGSGSEAPAVIDVGGDAGPMGCIQPTFPAEQPDLSVLRPPRFLIGGSTTQTTFGAQLQTTPGSLIDAEITVNSATRRATVELTNAWSPEQVIFVEQLEAGGSETLPLTLATTESTRGRYYMKVTLCGFDCDEREVIFDIHACVDDGAEREACSINGTYERTVFEDGELLQTDSTCIEFGGEPDVGSGSIVVQ